MLWMLSEVDMVPNLVAKSRGENPLAQAPELQRPGPLIERIEAIHEQLDPGWLALVGWMVEPYRQRDWYLAAACPRLLPPSPVAERLRVRKYDRAQTGEMAAWNRSQYPFSWLPYVQRRRVLTVDFTDWR
jgi:hypothetical protein